MNDGRYKLTDVKIRPDGRKGIRDCDSFQQPVGPAYKSIVEYAVNITAFYEDFTVAWDIATQNGHHNLQFLDQGNDPVPVEPAPVEPHNCGKHKYYMCHADHRCNWDHTAKPKKICREIKTNDADKIWYQKGYKPLYFYKGSEARYRRGGT